MKMLVTSRERLCNMCMYSLANEDVAVQPVGYDVTETRRNQITNLVRNAM